MSEPETPKPRVATPEEAAEWARTHDISAEETAEIIRKQQEEEEEKGRRLFGDGPRFPVPDSDTDA
ncbi:hypothetical protein OG474_18170 [Kribbella sp. NBC_01505]|uniref:hypothetical protein n=1 Tax=Kribbella sp. NBC_01505 TaxID=2903580 RepID=UPI00386B6689